MKEPDAEETMIAARPPPPPPHFEDKATLASARPVVPIETAKARERLRIIRRALPFILTAGFLGILVGGGIGYYETRRIGADPISESAGKRQLIQEKLTEERQNVSQSESSQNAASATLSLTSDNQAPTSEGKEAADTPNSASTIARPKRARRTVHLLKTEVRSNRRGAGRIQEIFAGTEPQ